MPRENLSLMNKVNQLLQPRNRFKKLKKVDMLRLLKNKMQKLKNQSRKLAMLSKLKMKELKKFQLLSSIRRANLKITKANLSSMNQVNQLLPLKNRLSKQRMVSQ